MYLRHTTVRRKGKTHTYWKLVRSVRHGGRVRQEVVAHLCRLDASGKSEHAVLSADGRFVAFESYATNLAPGTDGFVRHVYVHDLWTAETTLVSLGHQGQLASFNCHGTTISGDGRRVAFSSDADDLVADDTNDVSDVFVRDRLAGTTASGSERPAFEVS